MVALARRLMGSLDALWRHGSVYASGYFTQCRTLRSTDQRGCLGTVFLPRIQ